MALLMSGAMDTPETLSKEEDLLRNRIIKKKNKYDATIQERARKYLVNLASVPKPALKPLVDPARVLTTVIFVFRAACAGAHHNANIRIRTWPVHMFPHRSLPPF
jgi:hypothetical protein